MMPDTPNKLYGDAIGPLGFPLKSAAAHEAEAALKAQPTEVRSLFKTNINGQTIDGYLRAVVSTKAGEPNNAEHSEVSVITSDSVDRDHEVILPSGLDFSCFNKAPVVPYSHNYAAPPVGRALWVARTQLDNGRSGWKAKTRYTPRPATHPEQAEWFPDTIWHFVSCGDIPAKSIGFIPLSARAPTMDELRGRPDWKDATRLVDKAMVLEFSVCSIGANQDSLIDSVARAKMAGIRIAKELTDALGIQLPESSEPSPKTYSIPAPTPKGNLMPETAAVATTVTAKIATETDNAGGADAVGAAEAVMPNCPKCMSNTHVKDDGGAGDDMSTEMYHCENCGTQFQMDGETCVPISSPSKAMKTIALKSIAVNHKCVASARVLIMEGKIDRGEFSGDAIPRDAAHADCFLGANTDFGPEEKGHWMYPIGDGGTVNAKGVATAEAYAEKSGAVTIAAAAKKLSALIAAHADAEKAFIRPETIRKAQNRELESLKPEIARLVTGEIKNAFARATGRV